MKTTAALTTNGNKIYELNGLPMIFIKEKGISVPFVRYHNITTVCEALANLPNEEIDTEKMISDVEIIEKQSQRLTSLEKEVTELRKIKAYYGNLPEWLEAGFSSKEKYEKHLTKVALKNFYETLKKNFKLKTNKSVDEQLCFIFTTEYSGKNNGYRHFSRAINRSIERVSSINAYNRNKNLCVKKINGDVIICRGNIESNECIIKYS